MNQDYLTQEEQCSHPDASDTPKMTQLGTSKLMLLCVSMSPKFRDEKSCRSTEYSGSSSFCWSVCLYLGTGIVYQVISFPLNFSVWIYWCCLKVWADHSFVDILGRLPWEAFEGMWPGFPGCFPSLLPDSCDHCGLKTDRLSFCFTSGPEYYSLLLLTPLTSWSFFTLMLHLSTLTRSSSHLRGNKRQFAGAK